MIIYLHGFNSSPHSQKAQLLRRSLAARGSATRFVVPALSHWPSRAIAECRMLIESNAREPMCLIGSSLGGYYALWLAQRYALRAVLVNPAVRPYELLADHLGLQRSRLSGESYEFTDEHLRQLRALDVDAIARPQDILLLLTTGDEVLDYRAALGRYADVRQHVVPGGDHAFSNFGCVAERVLDFCAAGAPTPGARPGRQ